MDVINISLTSDETPHLHSVAIIWDIIPPCHFMAIGCRLNSEQRNNYLFATNNN